MTVFSKSTTIILTLLLLQFSILSFGQDLILNQYNNENEIKASGSITLLPGFHIPAGKTVWIHPDLTSINKVPFLSQPTTSYNYISIKNFKIPGVKTNADINAPERTTSDVNQIIQYLDGFGRTIQTVSVQASPDFKDIVQPYVYDGVGRQVTQYLPYTVVGNNGSYVNNVLSGQISFYNNPPAGVASVPNAAYSQISFETSPLSRETERGSSGSLWQISGGHTTKISYGTNNVSVNFPMDGFAVRRYTADFSTITGHEYERSLVTNGFFGSNQLQLTIIKDENWVSTDGKAGTLEEYKDKQGRVILKRKFNLKSGTIEVLSTYYVYDALGNLCFVLPPGTNSDYGVNQQDLDALCYQYRYDRRQRLVEKRIPDKDWEYLVYNNNNQLTYSQDGMQKRAHQWNWMKYDALGRVILTGVENNEMHSRGELQSIFDGFTGLIWEGRNNSRAEGYTVNTYPNTGTENLNVKIHTINFYDDYDFPGNQTFGVSSPNVSLGHSLNTKGLLTGSKINILGTTDMLLSINYYDDKAQLLNIKKQNHLGGTDIVTNVYSFEGELIKSDRAHLVAGNTTTVSNWYDFDHIGRKKYTRQSINNQNQIILSKLDYNDVGQLMRKSLNGLDGQSFSQNSTYSYNERGWLKRINDPDAINSSTIFGMELSYGNKSDAYNGNIGSVAWTTLVPPGLGLSQQKQTYVYDYDKLNRLNKANYVTSGSEGKFNEELEYDHRGNILTLKRRNNIASYLNDFTYNYTNGGVGNRLWQLADAGTAGVNSTYTYDYNGNQKTDSYKGISIDYNELNLPKTITKPGNPSLQYLYTAAGEKLRKTFGGNVRDYINGIEYNNNSIEFIQTEEGRAIPGAVYSYEYMLRDHLGNTRAAFNQNGQVIQVQDYYSFGLEMNPGNSYSQSPINKYKYNNKEKQDELGLGQYDYGARFYDPVIGRWNVVDGLAENHRSVTSYNYVLNNPMNNIDPFGLDTVQAKNITPEKWNKFEVKKDEIGLEEVSIQATRPIHDSQGRIIYEDGTVENFLYTGGEKNKYAVFTSRKTGEKTYFPGVDVSPTMVNRGAGSTYPWSTIHLSTKNNGLEDLEHEYGHVIDLEKNGKLRYIFLTMPSSFFSATKETIGNKTGFYSHRHQTSSTEVRANEYASEYFGPTSAIGKSRYYPKK